MHRELRDGRISLRVSRRIIDALKKTAVRERRTVADILNNILEERFPRARKARR